MNPSSITNRGSKEKTVTKRGEVYPLKDGDIISLLCTKHEEKGKFRLQFPDPEDNSQPAATDFEQTLAVSDLDILIDCIGDSPSQSRKNSSNLTTYMQREIREPLEPNNNTNVIKEVEPDNSVDKTIENDSQKNKHEKNSEEREEKEMSVHEDDETSQNNNANNNKTHDSIKGDNNNSINDNKTELMQVEEGKLTGRKRKAPSKRQHRKKINDETEDNNNTNNDDNNKSEDDESDVNEYSDGDGSPDTRHRRKRQRIDRLAENLMNLNEKTEDELESKNVNNKNEQVDSNDKNERDFSKEVKTI